MHNAYDFTLQKAFRAIDDWSYGYIDQSNLKRFLRTAGFVASKQELVAILRRFDMDGDAKISFAEFELGMRSTLANFKGNGKKRPQSSGGYRKRRTLSRDMT